MDISTLVVGVCTLLFGAAFCFLGYRYFRILLPIWGFIAGFWVSEAFVARIFGDSDTAIIAGWIIGLAGGLILAGLSYFLFKVAVAILGATFGLWFVAALLSWLGMESSLLVSILAILGAILFAVLTFQENLRKYLVIAFTALIGATGIVLGLLFLFSPLSVDIFRAGLAPLVPSVLQESGLAAVLWLVLALLGAAIQWINSRDVDSEEAYKSGESGTEETFVVASPEFEGEAEGETMVYDAGEISEFEEESLET
ncbi:MAG: DUF4203 domain-containing protein [Chloroflexota bacterium]|jgi:hypothetical protein